ncbi:MAG: hypothetical protein RIG61_04950 [Deltaproteobacteria bacterium]
MKSRLNQFILIFPVLIAVTILSCSSEEKADMSGKTYDDPFAYCEAAGTVDSPGPEYKGPAVPESIAEGLKKEFGSPESAPTDVFKRGTYWRCMDGRVYACNVGANLPCTEKADTSKNPNKGMTDYCKDNPNAEFIPAYASGRSTVYEWKCKGSKPEIVKKIIDADPVGYQKNIWYKISPPE